MSTFSKCNWVCQIFRYDLSTCSFTFLYSAYYKLLEIRKFLFSAAELIFIKTDSICISTSWCLSRKWRNKSEAREWLHDSDKTQTNKLEWWIILKISLREKAGVPKTLVKQKLRLHSLYFPQNTLIMTESRGEFSELHSLWGWIHLYNPYKRAPLSLLGRGKRKYRREIHF